MRERAVPGRQPSSQKLVLSLSLTPWVSRRPFRRRKPTLCWAFSNGPGRDRTCDLGIKSPARHAATSCEKSKHAANRANRDCKELKLNVAMWRQACTRICTRAAVRRLSGELEAPWGWKALSAEWREVSWNGLLRDFQSCRIRGVHGSTMRFRRCEGGVRATMRASEVQPQPTEEPCPVSGTSSVIGE